MDRLGNLACSGRQLRWPLPPILGPVPVLYGNIWNQSSSKQWKCVAWLDIMSLISLCIFDGENEVKSRYSLNCDQNNKTRL